MTRLVKTCVFLDRTSGTQKRIVLKSRTGHIFDLTS